MNRNAADYAVSAENSISFIIKLQFIFFLMSLLLVLLDFFMRDSINQFVWIRSLVLTVLSLVYIRIGMRLRTGKRSTYFRVLIIAILGTLGIVAISVNGEVYPLWMRVEQCVQGIVLIGIAVVLFRPSVRAKFARA